MIPLNLWEHQNGIKNLYARCVGPICEMHHITRMELDILLFLANNPQYDTAKEIIEVRYLSKSQVSASIRLLEERGFIRRFYEETNRKTAHLVICGPASSIIEDGRAAQERVIKILLKDFTPGEMDDMKRYTEKIWKNIDSYLKEEAE